MRYARFALLLAASALLPAAAQDRHAAPTEGGLPFEEDLESVLVQGAERSIAALWGDYDGDGDLDLLVTDDDNGAYDDLFRNEGGGMFTLRNVVTNDLSAATTYSGAVADFNDDGDLDFAGASLNGGSFYLNQGRNGPFGFAYRRTRIEDFDEVRDALAADFNGDGRLDLFIGRRSNLPNVLIQNDGDRGIALLGGDVYEDTDDTASACWGDADNDGDPDLFVANSSPVNRYYVNDDGVLVRDLSQPFLDLEGISTGCAWGDYDGDSDLDLAVTLTQTVTQGGAQLFRNDGGSFVPVPIESRQLTTTGLSWGDIDNDGDLDLAVGHRNGASPTLYTNDGGAFTAQDFGDPLFATALTLVDDDGDGDLDLFITNGGFLFNERNQLFRNTTNGTGNWLEVDLGRSAGRNRFGVGAHIYAYATVGGADRTLLRPVLTRSGWLAQNGNRVHFGLGDATTVDSLVVVWPDGVEEDRTVLYGVAANQIVAVTGTEAAGDAPLTSASAGAPAAFAVEGVHPNPARGALTITVHSGSSDAVRVEVLDVLGRRVAMLEAAAEPGASVPVVWDGADAAGRAAPAGLYVLRVRQGAHTQTAKVTVVR